MLPILLIQYISDWCVVAADAAHPIDSVHIRLVCICVTPGATVSVPYLSRICDLVFVCLCVCLCHAWSYRICPIKKISVIWCLFVCVLVSRLELPYLSRICDYKGSTGLYITAGHKQLATIFVVLCIRLPDIEGDLERKLIGRRGGNKIRMGTSCGIGDRMNQQKQT